jgi:hypothetical protein
VCLCRIWDTHNILQKTVVKPTTPSAARVGVTTVAYNTTGKMLAAGMSDGTLQVRGVRATPAFNSTLAALHVRHACIRRVCTPRMLQLSHAVISVPILYECS